MSKTFSSPLKFADHLMKAATVELIAINNGLHEASNLIAADAWKQIGHLQEAVPPYPAWEELAESTKEQKERLGYGDEGNDWQPLLREGNLRDSIGYEVNMPGLYAIVGSKSKIAAFQEFGTSRGIPPRPFIGTAFYKNKEMIAQIFGKAIYYGIAGGNNIKNPLGQELGYNQDIKL